MALDTWLAFVATSVVVLVIPGPTILTVISYSLAHGPRANAPLVAAVALGDSTALLCSLFGLGGLLATSAFWFDVVRWAGGLYLLYLGVRMIAGAGRGPRVTELHAAESSWHLFAKMYAVTALNPKGVVFYVVIVPQFLNAQAALPVQLAVLALTFVTLASANATLYTIFAGNVRSLLASPAAQRRFNVLGGSLLSAAGIWALVSRRSA